MSSCINMFCCGLKKKREEEGQRSFLDTTWRYLSEQQSRARLTRPLLPGASAIQLQILAQSHCRWSKGGSEIALSASAASMVWLHVLGSPSPPLSVLFSSSSPTLCLTKLFSWKCWFAPCSASAGARPPWLQLSSFQLQISASHPLFSSCFPHPLRPSPQRYSPFTHPPLRLLFYRFLPLHRLVSGARRPLGIKRMWETGGNPTTGF